MSSKIILSAGMPRSGSTWLFNAARLLLKETEQNVVAVWVDDFNKKILLDSNILLIKIHDFNAEWIAKADLIIYSYRDIRDAIASAERKFSTIPSLEQATYLVDLDLQWRGVADFILRYEDLFLCKLSILQNLMKLFELTIQQGKLQNILHQLDFTSYNDPGNKNEVYHLENLLHRKHITHGGYGSWKKQVEPSLIAEIEKIHYEWFLKHNYDF